MDKYEIVLNDIKAILETIGEVNKVSHGKVVPLTSEDTFTSVYIVPEMDSFTLDKASTGASAYLNSFFVRLEVNMDCSHDDLYWVKLRRIIIDALLADTAIWTNILDRDVVSVAHDGYDNYPLKAMAILFEFKLREPCIV
jgi:hypothetical protein